MKYQSRNKTFNFVDSQINPNHMTEKEIVKKAMDKAVKNGFDYNGKIFLYVDKQRYNDVIFRKDFAKAFWGEKHDWDKHSNGDWWCKICNQCSSEHLEYPEDICWEHNLKQMVLEDNKISYLEKFL